MKKCYATIHVWLHDMDHNIDLNYRRKIHPVLKKSTDKIYIKIYMKILVGRKIRL